MDDVGKHDCDDPDCRSCHNCGKRGIVIDSEWNLCEDCIKESEYRIERVRCETHD